MESNVKFNMSVRATGEVGPAKRPDDKSDQPSLPLEAAQLEAQLEAPAVEAPAVEPAKKSTDKLVVKKPRAG